MTDQAPARPPVQLALTPALGAGRGRVEQCAGCGCLVATTDLADPQRLGPCPACGCATWWPQRLPVEELPPP